jgi:hypothetical protein
LAGHESDEGINPTKLFQKKPRFGNEDGVFLSLAFDDKFDTFIIGREEEVERKVSIQ